MNKKKPWDEKQQEEIIDLLKEGWSLSVALAKINKKEKEKNQRVSFPDKKHTLEDYPRILIEYNKQQREKKLFKKLSFEAVQFNNIRKVENSLRRARGMRPLPFERDFLRGEEQKKEKEKKEKEKKKDKN